MSHNAQAFGRDHVLTIQDKNGREGEVKFIPDGSSSRIVLRPTLGNALIMGEDLFAFRELLNEFPEEAFKRPADPVKVPEWHDGDSILRNYQQGGIYLLQRDGGEWRTHGPAANENWRGEDCYIDSLLAGEVHTTSTFKVVRKQGKDL